jgi:hypothetical protein
VYGASLVGSVLLLTVCTPPPPRNEWFVAPRGLTSGNGHIATPFNLAAALQSDTIQPGDTIYLRGGTYVGPLVSTLSGAPGAPIIVRPYEGERVVIDANGMPNRQAEGNVFTIRGTDAEYWNLEVIDTMPTRSYPDRSNPRPTGISIYGQRIKLVNPIVHDTGNGIGLWNSGDSEVYGAIVFNNGAMTPVPSGHGLYIQNDEPGTTTMVTNSLSFNNFQMGLHAYGEGGTVVGLSLDQFVAFNNGSPSLETWRRDANIFIGPRSNSAGDVTVTRSHTHHPSATTGVNVRLGYTAQNRSAVVRGNHFMGGAYPIAFTTWDSLTFEGNTVYATPRPANVTSYERLVVAQNLNRKGPYLWSNNAYYDQTTPEGGTVYHPFEIIPAPSGFAGEFAHWQVATGDWTSTYEIGRPPDGVFVMPNRYERGRAHVVVYNWSKQGSVSINLDEAGLAPGQYYFLVDVQDLSGPPVATGVYERGQSVAVAMNRVRVAPPVGWETTIPVHTAPEFAVFLVLPVNIPQN